MIHGTKVAPEPTDGILCATMRFEPEALHSANAGLNVARDFMEKVKQEFPWIFFNGQGLD